MDASQVTSAINATTPPATPTKGNQALGKDQFLQLLVTQLKYQDPSKPMDDTQFISQMAQFSSLEQMQNLNTKAAFQQLTQASGMIGKQVKVTAADGTQDHGKVTKVTQDNAAQKVTLVLDSGKSYDFSTVTEVSA